MPKEGDAPKKLPDGKESKGAGAPKDLDLTPAIGDNGGSEARRPY